MKNLNTYLKNVLALTLTLPSLTFAATNYNLSAALQVRESFYTDYIQVEQDFNDRNKNEALKAWFAAKDREFATSKEALESREANKSYRVFATNELVSGGSYKTNILSQKVIDWVIHYQSTKQYKKSAAALSAYVYSTGLMLLEIANDPRVSNSNPVKAEAIRIGQDLYKWAPSLRECFYSQTPKAGSDLSAFGTLFSTCIAHSSVQVMAETLKTSMQHSSYTGSNQLLSLTGYIPGNKVEQLLENYYEPAFISYMAPMTKTVIDNYGTLTIEQFKKMMTSKSDALNKFFTTAEGFPEITGSKKHRAWDLTKQADLVTGSDSKHIGRKNIYGEVFQSIEEAKKSVFIDVFFLGGSIGAMLTKRLIQKVQENPNFWVYILNDRNNPLGYNNEMQPVYNYIRAYAENFPMDRMVILTPRIDLKRTAYPDFADMLLKDSTLEGMISSSQKAGLIGQLSFYPKGKSDHSKVIVVDGLSKAEGIAFVGSKNYTDTSGGVAYDEVTKIQGPAVAAILDSYYYDLTEALKIPSNSQYVSDLYTSSAGGKNSAAGIEAKIASILAQVDVLSRVSGGKNMMNLTWTAAEMQGGTTPIMIGENNVYGTIRTALPQVIAGIRSAQKQVIISEQFIYEPSVVRALKEVAAPKDRNKTPVKVYILLADMADHLNPTKAFSHIPNVSYAEELVRNPNIQVKWKKIPATHLEALEEAHTKYGANYAPEYHLKSLSIDGVLESQKATCEQPNGKSFLVQSLSQIETLPLLISGSANKDVMTMTGGFREFQVVLYDRMATVDHDCQFWSRFTDPDQSTNIVKADGQMGMNIPADLVQKGLTERRFNQLIRDLVETLYNVVTGYSK